MKEKHFGNLLIAIYICFRILRFGIDHLNETAPLAKNRTLMMMSIYDSIVSITIRGSPAIRQAAHKPRALHSNRYSINLPYTQHNNFDYDSICHIVYILSTANCLRIIQLISQLRFFDKSVMCTY